jgi:nondiscriminating glutamyl-tRNA synthetase
MSADTRGRAAGGRAAGAKKKQALRVRFAPSPTGYLHLGGARTALFNWLFARHEGGAFVLRIEDTDIERSARELEDALLEDLAWLGLTWDEGPNQGGRFAPYRQSERIEAYRERADKLVEAGLAYPCFCTEKELERKKEERLKAGLPPQYDGSCRGLTPFERERRRAEGCPESIRFAVPEDSERRLADLIRGEVVFPAGMVGDFVIVRSNGLPTYNFAAVVDDSLMEITHVIRGEEHLSNTLRQIFAYEALGLAQPRFAHIPLILGADRSKLSKRHGAPNVADFRDRGYPAPAVVNYLAFLGWSPPGDREILSLEELIRDFTLERVSPSPSIFDETKLNWVSARHIRAGADRYFEEALDFFPEDVRSAYPRERLREIFGILSENLPAFSRIERDVAPFRPGPPEFFGDARDAIAGAGELLALFRAELASLEDWSAPALKEAIARVGATAGVGGKSLYMPLRAALTGTIHGPDLVRIMEIRGKEDVVESLRSALADLESVE